MQVAVLQRQESTFLPDSLTLEVALAYSAMLADEMGLTRVRNLGYDDLRAISIAADTADVPTAAILSFRRADLVMAAVDSSGETCYIVAEVSFTVSNGDLNRAIHNAHLLNRFTGRPAYPAVAGMDKDERIEGRLESGEVFWHQLERSKLDLD